MLTNFWSVLFRIFFVVGLLLCMAKVSVADPSYLVGVGKADITGPAAELGMLGYAQTNQKTAGIRSRLYARSFIVVDRKTGERVVFVSVDSGMVFHLVTQGVEADLRAVHGDLYTQRNMVLSATHTHSGPGGHSSFALYNFTIFGFNKQNYMAIKNGIVSSILRAHNDLAPGRVFWASGESHTPIAVNRSKTAFDNNKEVWKNKFADGVDKEMSLLTFSRNGRPIGTINWYAVHPVSMNGGNQLINGDNKGFASYLWEQEEGGGYVAAFAQTASGDISPNLKLDGTGPGCDALESTEIIGSRQFDLAKRLAAGPSTELTGPVDSVHRFVDLENTIVHGRYTATEQEASTCTGALGVGFAAGTEDGRGPSDIFQEGTTKWNPIFQGLANLINRPSEAMKTCHSPKPILLAVGKGGPAPWAPRVLPFSILKIGPLHILSVPSEMTVAAGRMLKEAVGKRLGGQVVIAGLSNGYSSYVSTYEEYQTQNYEGASTLYGPHTHGAYLQAFDRLVNKLTEPGFRYGFPEPTPRKFALPRIRLQPGVVADGVPTGEFFGYQVGAPNKVYHLGETVVVAFRTGHPKNALHTDGSFLEVQRKGEDGVWQVVATDHDWETAYHWQREGAFLSTRSLAFISWRIPVNGRPGTYRIVHMGDMRKLVPSRIRSFLGTSDHFQVEDRPHDLESYRLMGLVAPSGGMLTLMDDESVQARADYMDRSARFEMVYLAGDQVMFRHHQSGGYLMVNKHSKLVLGEGEPTAASYFSMMESSKNKAYFLSHENNMYLRAGRHGVWADGGEPDEQALFERFYW